MSSEDRSVTPGDELWGAIEDDLREAFGEDADLTVYPGDDHLDVRVIPRTLEERLEAEHDLEVVPYSALRMTIRPDSEP